MRSIAAGCGSWSRRQIVRVRARLCCVIVHCSKDCARSKPRRAETIAGRTVESGSAPSGCAAPSGLTANVPRRVETLGLPSLGQGEEPLRRRLLDREPGPRREPRRRRRDADAPDEQVGIGRVERRHLACRRLRGVPQLLEPRPPELVTEDRERDPGGRVRLVAAPRGTRSCGRGTTRGSPRVAPRARRAGTRAAPTPRRAARTGRSWRRRGRPSAPGATPTAPLADGSDALDVADRAPCGSRICPAVRERLKPLPSIRGALQRCSVRAQSQTQAAFGLSGSISFWFHSCQPQEKTEPSPSSSRDLLRRQRLPLHDLVPGRRRLEAVAAADSLLAQEAEHDAEPVRRDPDRRERGDRVAVALPQRPIAEDRAERPDLGGGQIDLADDVRRPSPPSATTRPRRPSRRTGTC